MRRQFQPVLFYEDYVLELHPDRQENNDKMMKALRDHREILGITTIVTDDRIPKTGLDTVDKYRLEHLGQEYTAESIINELFYSQYVTLGFVPISAE